MGRESGGDYNAHSLLVNAEDGEERNQDKLVSSLSVLLRKCMIQLGKVMVEIGAEERVRYHDFIPVKLV